MAQGCDHLILDERRQIFHLREARQPVEGWMDGPMGKGSSTRLREVTEPSEVARDDELYANYHVIDSSSSWGIYTHPDATHELGVRVPTPRFWPQRTKRAIMAELENVITDSAGLREIIGSPSHRILNKVIDRIDELAARFITASPFAVIASRNGDGHLDVSPRGDAAGSFVKIMDQQTLAVPDRPGNRRLDTLTNILDDPNIGIIFLVPGKRETLRISGTAQIVRDQWLREELTHQGKLPDLAIVVTVKRLYFHCAKSMIRSHLWQPDEWLATDHLPSLAETMVTHGRLSESLDEMQTIIDRDVAERLY